MGRSLPLLPLRVHRGLRKRTQLLNFIKIKSLKCSTKSVFSTKSTLAVSFRNPWGVYLIHTAFHVTLSLKLSCRSWAKQITPLIIVEMATAWSLLLDYGTLNTYLGAFRVGVKDRRGKSLLTKRHFYFTFRSEPPAKRLHYISWSSYYSAFLSFQIKFVSSRLSTRYHESKSTLQLISLPMYLYLPFQYCRHQPLPTLRLDDLRCQRQVCQQF